MVAGTTDAVPDAVTIRVRYPLERGRIALRSSRDWERTVEADDVSEDGRTATFNVTTSDYLYFKPVLLVDGRLHWSLGDNYLAVAARTEAREVYPHFFDAGGCSVCDLLDLQPTLGEGNRYRVFRPPGYTENTLRRYAVLYMQDGQNLFFPSEAFGGKHWRVAETLTTLTAMNAINQVIVVGVYPDDRQREYTLPGYGAYGRFLTSQLKPAVDATYRTLPGREHTAVMGSSLGGVVSFYLAWEFPDTFGMAACMSSTFGWRDDLLERVASEPARDVRFYLDSGWPRDNYEVTRSMAVRLQRRGYRAGQDLLYLSFPQALHNEQFWATRSHIPYQFFFGR